MNASRPDQAHVEELLVQFAPALHRFVDARIPDRFRGEIAADDVLQEVWLSVFRADWSVVHSAEAWLFSIARRRLEDACRRARAQKRGGDQAFVDTSHSEGLLAALHGPQPDPLRSPSQQLITAEWAARISEALQALDERTRQALQLHYQEGLTREAVAEVLEIPEATASSLIFRGLRQLREIIPDRSTGRLGA